MHESSNPCTARAFHARAARTNAGGTVASNAHKHARQCGRDAVRGSSSVMRVSMRATARGCMRERGRMRGSAGEQRAGMRSRQSDFGRRKFRLSKRNSGPKEKPGRNSHSPENSSISPTLKIHISFSRKNQAK